MGIAYGVTTNFQATKGIVQDGLVLNLDAGVKESYSSGSTWSDLTGANNGSLVNMNATNLSKDQGGVFNFDGTNEYINFSTFDDLDGVTELTIGVWFNYEKMYGTAANWPVMLFIIQNVVQFNLTSYVAKDTYSTGSPATDVTKPTISLRPGDDGAWVTLAASRIASNNAWHYMVMTYDGSDAIRCYFDGNTEQTNSSPPSSLNSTSQGGAINVSVNNAGTRETGYSGIGKIGCVHIYNRALTAAEVSRNFNVMKHRFGI